MSFRNEFFIQLIGFIGTGMIILGMQQKTYQRVVFCKISNELICGLQYFLLGGYTGMIMNLASCLTNSVYWYRIKHNKDTKIFQIIFGIVFVLLGCLSWQGWISILAILAKFLSSISLGINDTKVIRRINLISTPCWLIYDIYVFSLACICSDILVLGSVIVAIIRLDIKKSDSL